MSNSKKELMESKLEPMTEDEKKNQQRTDKLESMRNICFYKSCSIIGTVQRLKPNYVRKPKSESLEPKLINGLNDKSDSSAAFQLQCHHY